MKILKILLSSMFVFTAVIRSTQVGECGPSYQHYTGIKADFDIKNAAGVVVSHGDQCGSTWPEIKDGIRFQLRLMQLQVDDNQFELKELSRLNKVAKEIKNVEVTQ